MSASDSKKRRRAARLARYAAAIGGLGTAWLLLSAGGASADSLLEKLPVTADAAKSGLELPVLGDVKLPDLSAAKPAAAVAKATPLPAAKSASTALVDQVVRPVPQLVQTAGELVTATVRSVPVAVQKVQSTASTTLSGTTSSAGELIRSVPTLVSPVLSNAPAPVGSLVTDTTSTLGDTVSSVGGTVDQAVSQLPVAELTKPVSAVTEPVAGIVDVAVPSVVEPVAGIVDTTVPPVLAPVVSLPGLVPAVDLPAAPVSQPAAADSRTSAAVPARSLPSDSGNRAAIVTAGQAAYVATIAQLLEPSNTFSAPAALRADVAHSGTAKGNAPGPQPAHDMGGAASTSHVLRSGNDNPVGLATAGTTADGDSAAGLESPLQSLDLPAPPAFDPGSTPD